MHLARLKKPHVIRSARNPPNRPFQAPLCHRRQVAKSDDPQISTPGFWLPQLSDCLTWPRKARDHPSAPGIGRHARPFKTWHAHFGRTFRLVLLDSIASLGTSAKVFHLLYYSIYRVRHPSVVLRIIELVRYSIAQHGDFQEECVENAGRQADSSCGAHIARIHLPSLSRHNPVLPLGKYFTFTFHSTTIQLLIRHL